MSSYDLCVGLGHHCESTFQIRRITGQESASFFDWLELDITAVQKLVETDFPISLRAGRMAMTEEGRGAYDLDTGIRYFHDFTAQPEAALCLDDVESQLPEVRRKFTFLARRWREMTSSGDRVLYVRQDPHGGETSDDLRLLKDTIASRHPGHRFAILWLRRPGMAEVGALPPGIACREVPLLPGRWEGDDAAWDALFDSLPNDQLWPSDVRV